MATFTRELLSGSTSGTPLALTSTDSAGATTLHTASTNKEEIYLFGWSKSTAVVEAFIELGDTVSPVIVPIPPRAGQVPILAGYTLTGSKVVKGYCSTVSTSALFVGGYINKII